MVKQEVLSLRLYLEEVGICQTLQQVYSIKVVHSISNGCFINKQIVILDNTLLLLHIIVCLIKDIHSILLLWVNILKDIHNTLLLTDIHNILLQLVKAIRNMLHLWVIHSMLLQWDILQLWHIILSTLRQWVQVLWGIHSTLLLWVIRNMLLQWVILNMRLLWVILNMLRLWVIHSMRLLWVTHNTDLKWGTLHILLQQALEDLELLVML
mmetsp:Transcript_14461/g.16051  ORF Transcript_14461/g.16051 Transcript_14461/m.16051 type:complete len:210 (+) Transcript_14461:1331-1960(+)